MESDAGKVTKTWRDNLRFDPVPALLDCGNPAVAFFARRDLLGEKPGNVRSLWALPDAAKLLRRQQPDGSWKYPGDKGKEHIRSQTNYNQLETYRNLGFLVEMHGMTKEHPAIAGAAEFLFGFQTKEGDFRGIYGTQYTPNYTGGIMELLIKAGYAGDPRITRGFDWLLSIRQDDGGWAIPLRTHNMPLDIQVMGADTILPDRSKPSSHMVTGVVLRAFAAHPKYRRSPRAKPAAGILASRLFQRDTDRGRGEPEFWLKLTFPFWFTDLLSAMDSLSLLGFSPDQPRIAETLQWFADRQSPTGLWDLYMLKNKDKSPHLWITLAICRVFQRFYNCP